MPNRETHIIASVVVVFLAGIIAGAGFIFNHFPHAIIFIVGSVFPDIIEPARSYTHRKFFHSRLVMKIMAAGSALTFILGMIKPEFHLLTAGAAGYVLHLLMDSTTEMGLP